MAEKKYEIKAIDAVQLFKTTFLLMVIGGLIFGLIMLVMSSLSGDAGVMGASLLGILMMAILFPLLYGAALAIGALIYNFVAGKVGGYKWTIDIEG